MTSRAEGSAAPGVSLRFATAPDVWRRAAQAGVLVAAYYLAARLGLTFAVVNVSTTAVWPPTGIALAAVMLYGRRVWPAIALGAFLANVATSGSVPVSLGIAAGNTLEALVGGYLVRRWAGGVGALWHVPGVLHFVAASGAATLVSATIGVASLELGGQAAPDVLADVWRTWWLGDAIGAVMYAPFLVFWLVRSRVGWQTQRLVEGAVVFTAMLALAGFGFSGAPASVAGLSVAFLCFPFVVWAAFRLGQREATTCVVALSAVALWGTFARTPDHVSVLLLQSFAGVLAITGTAVGALAFQHRQLQAELEDRVARRTRELAESNASLRGEAERRQHVEEALRASELRLLDAQAVAHVGSWEWDIAGNRVWWSEELCRIYGTPAPAPSYEEFLARVHPDDREQVQRIVSRAFEDAQPFAYEHRIVRPDGSVRTVSASGRVVTDEAGRPVRMLGTGQDITERRHAEAAEVAEQSARRRAEEANRAKDEFLALVSHELRTPLNAMLGWARMLSDGTHDPEHLARGLEVIHRNAQMQAWLINDLLDVSEIKTGQLRLDVRPMNLHPIVSLAIDTVRVPAGAKGIQLTSTLAEHAPVHGDPHRLQQVVWNLLTNAVKFTPAGGQIDVRLDRAGETVSIQVTDSGQGIDPAILRHIFEPFWQGDPVRRDRGLGLGLMIVRTLVEAHGGRVEADSGGLGRGATFRVSLPGTEA